MRDKLVVGNWKMNGGLVANAKLLARLASEWTHREQRKLVVCVPAPYVGQAQAALSSGAVMWGVQDVSEHASGAYTGEVAARQVDAVIGALGAAMCRCVVAYEPVWAIGTG